jgi:hypothetical protein
VEAKHDKTKHSYSVKRHSFSLIDVLSLQNMDKYPSKSKYNDRFYDKLDESPSSRHRDESPVDRPSPRYHNKASYIEKTKEKLERGK